MITFTFVQRNAESYDSLGSPGTLQTSVEAQLQQQGRVSICQTPSSAPATLIHTKSSTLHLFSWIWNANGILTIIRSSTFFFYFPSWSSQQPLSLVRWQTDRTELPEWTCREQITSLASDKPKWRDILRRILAVLCKCIKPFQMGLQIQGTAKQFSEAGCGFQTRCWTRRKAGEQARKWGLPSANCCCWADRCGRKLM